ncbi:MAG: hypothetical protein IJM43_07020 [Bacteroidaceae bacterium]|nr:hypothetical protein [Bacteroidaceae bacterium]
MNKKAEIPSFKDIFDLLQLPEWLNGIECNMSSLISNKKREKDILLETARQFQYLYDAICSGRFNLAMACKKDYTHDFLEEDAPSKAHVWVQIQFVNNAILWYNSTFDFLAQAVWLYYKLYEHAANFTIDSTKDRYSQIRERCNREEMIKIGERIVDSPDLMKKVKNLRNKLTGNIPKWANYLKHRGYIQYKEYTRPSSGLILINCEKGEDILSAITRGANVAYNSSETQSILSVREAIKTMINYHQLLMDVTKAMAGEFDLLEENESQYHLFEYSFHNTSNNTI